MPLMYHYQFMHLPSGKKFTGAQAFLTEKDFLANINRWNQSPQWKYWAESTLGTPIPEGA